MDFSIPLKCKQDGSRLKSHNTMILLTEHKQFVCVFVIGEKYVCVKWTAQNKLEESIMDAVMKAMSPSLRNLNFFIDRNSGLKKEPKS